MLVRLLHVTNPACIPHSTAGKHIGEHAGSKKHNRCWAAMKAASLDQSGPKLGHRDSGGVAAALDDPLLGQLVLGCAALVVCCRLSQQLKRGVAASHEQGVASPLRTIGHSSGWLGGHLGGTCAGHGAMGKQFHQCQATTLATAAAHIKMQASVDGAQNKDLGKAHTLAAHMHGMRATALHGQQTPVTQGLPQDAQQACTLTTEGAENYPPSTAQRECA